MSSDACQPPVCSEAAKPDRFWSESSAPIPRLGGAEIDEGITVFGRPESIHSKQGGDGMPVADICCKAKISQAT